MAVDNPSYFSIHNSDNPGSSNTASNNATSRGFGGFFRRSKSQNKTLPRHISSSSSSIIGSRMAQQQIQPISFSPKSPVVSSPVASGTAGHSRRTLRNLFRSASASADCEKTRQFLKGEPRPSDVAPPSPYLSGRCHTHSEGSSGRSKPSRRRTMKSTSELLNMDMIFCGLPGDAPTSPPHHLPRRSEDNDYYRFDSDCSSVAATLPLDEIEDERSYYNVSATLPKKGSPLYSSMGRRKSGQFRRNRRHSIGTFLDGDDCATVATTSARYNKQNMVVQPDARDVVDYSVDGSRYGGRSTRFGTRHAPTTFASKPTDVAASTSAAATRDDVIFISSKDNEASTLWVNYLTACFEQISRQQGRPPFRVSQITFEDPLFPGADQKIRTSRLQIIVVCPILLDRVAERPDQAIAISRQLNVERVLAMMLGVQDAHLNANHRQSLVTYQSWRKFFVKDQDETFVGQFLGAAVAILGNGCNSAAANAGAATNDLKIDKTGFSVHPKKVKMGHNRVLALLNEPLHPDDTIIVQVDRCGEALDVTHVKRRNPYTLQFCIPERCLDVSMLVGVRIARNGQPLGVRQVKCESRLRELDQILRAHDNPLEFMCQTFGFNSGDREQLDNWMVHAFQKNVPPHFNLLSNPPGDVQLSKNHSSSEENPTLLHFAARFGLEKLAWQLLECPGSDVACDMRNANDLTPAELAEQAGHARLAHQLRGYMQMNEFSNMYSYLKVMSENANGNANGYRAPSQQTDRSHPDDRKEDYCRPRPISEAYSVPPCARPVTRAFPDYSTPPPLPQPNPIVPSLASEDSASSSTRTLENSSTTPMTAYSSNSTLNAASSHCELPLQGYMQMNPAGLRSPDSTISTPTAQPTNQISNNANPETPTAESNKPDSDQLSTKSSIGRQSSSSSKSRESPQDELLEIITDFKNNVFTISEVERLVENWRNRNDVQQSFKDKQRQLSDMRDEYERIQKRIKDEMRAPTPFDRIKKFFTKGKKESKDSGAASEDSSSSSKPNSVTGNLVDRRPVSSLSLHSVSSSSSSGRMSTVSGCSGTSLGDSGTHSDTDDRRLQHPVAEDTASSGGMTNYEIPPAPKPFHGRLFNNHHHHHHTKFSPSPSRVAPSSRNNSELDLRAVKSSHCTADDKEYYIAFPPSGLPIHSFKTASIKDLKTPGTPMEPREFFPHHQAKDRSIDSPTNKFNVNNNYANVSPILQPPPGMCIPFQYMNLTWESNNGKTEEVTTPKVKHVDNVLTIQPEIHPEPTNLSKLDERNNNEQSTSENEAVSEGNDKTPEPASPKILNTEQEAETTSCIPDYTNVIQVAASEEIARNFGVTLKKPPVPPRCEISFAQVNGLQDTKNNNNETAKASE